MRPSGVSVARPNTPHDNDKEKMISGVHQLYDLLHVKEQVIPENVYSMRGNAWDCLIGLGPFMVVIRTILKGFLDSYSISVMGAFILI